jgi:hypothetical protein
VLRAVVLTGPGVAAGTRPGPISPQRLRGSDDMVTVSLQDHPLTATAALVWNGDLPRRLQQILFDIADRVTSPAQVPSVPSCAELVPVSAWRAS